MLIKTFTLPTLRILIMDWICRVDQIQCLRFYVSVSIIFVSYLSSNTNKIPESFSVDKKKEISAVTDSIYESISELPLSEDSGNYLPTYHMAVGKL